MGKLIAGFHPGYERNGIYTLEQVFAQLGNSWAVFDGDVLSVCSLRYRLFAINRHCVCCGLEGTYFAKERSAKRFRQPGVLGEKLFRATTKGWHFNLYALGLRGEEILMTKDHILPRSKGGQDVIGNLQTMCRPCNNTKRDETHYQAMLPFCLAGDL
jgi:hypothetical protein